MTPSIFTMGLVGIALAAAPARGQPLTSEVSFAGAGDFALKGTLTVPAGDEDMTGPWPGVLLLPGSGPTDRDGNQPPFLKTDLLAQLAGRLAEAGVASFRFDKRAAHVYAAAWPRDPETLNAFFAWEPFIGDVKAAWRTPRERDEIDAKRCAVLGHSEGGLFALQVARDLAGREPPAALVLAATAGRTLDVVLREQIGAQLDRAGVAGEPRDRFMASLDGAIAAAVEGRPVPDDLPPGLRPLFQPTSMKLLRAYFTVDPAALAAEVEGPVLVVQGRSDAQVSAERDAPVLIRALRGRAGDGAGGRCELVLVDATSHNLKAVERDVDPGFTGPVQEEAAAAICRFLADALKP